MIFKKKRRECEYLDYCRKCCVHEDKEKKCGDCYAFRFVDSVWGYCSYHPKPIITLRCRDSCIQYVKRRIR